MGKTQKRLSAYFVTLYYKHIFIKIVVKEIKKKKTSTGNQPVKQHSIKALLSNSLPTKVELYIGLMT